MLKKKEESAHNVHDLHNTDISGGAMAKSATVLAPLLQVGLLQVRILVAARRGKNVWSMGKPRAPNSVSYVPQYIDESTANVKVESWLVKTLNTPPPPHAQI